MAVSLKVGIGYLVAEFFAHALVVLDPLDPAGTVAVLFRKRFAQSFDDFAVFVIDYPHLFFSVFGMDQARCESINPSISDLV